MGILQLGSSLPPNTHGIPTLMFYWLYDFRDKQKSKKGVESKTVTDILKYTKVTMMISFRGLDPLVCWLSIPTSATEQAFCAQQSHGLGSFLFNPSLGHTHQSLPNILPTYFHTWLPPMSVTPTPSWSSHFFSPFLAFQCPIQESLIGFTNSSLNKIAAESFQGESFSRTKVPASPRKTLAPCAVSSDWWKLS